MRIGIITGEYPPLQGGVGDFTDILSQHLAKLEHHVFIFTEKRARQAQPHIPVTATVARWGYPTIRAIQRWVRMNNLDIINLQFQTAAYQMSPWIHFLPDMIDRPVVTTFHDLRFPYLFPKAGPLRTWIVRHLAQSSAGVIVTNPQDYEQINGLSNSVLVPIGSNILSTLPADYNREEWRLKAGARTDDFLLAHFGFINHSKGVDTLLHALKDLNDTATKLVMIGGRTGTADPTNANYANSIDRLIDKLNLQRYINWTGFVNNEAVTAYLHAADAVVLPFRDGASYRRSSLIVAIQHECPIITSTPTHPMPTFNDKNLYLVDPEDPGSLARAIQHLKDDPERRVMLRQGVSQLKVLFDWYTIAQDTITLFQRIIGTTAV